MTRPALRPPREKDVQRWCVDLYRKTGGYVYTTSQYRPSQVTEGIPDLFVMYPRRGLAFWMEVKAPNGRLRASQRAFRERALASGQLHIVGGIEEARLFLVEQGILVGGVE